MECPHCGRDNTDYGDICTAEDCPSNIAEARYRCTECGLEDFTPDLRMGERADLSYGEIAVCPECGSEDWELIE